MHELGVVAAFALAIAVAGWCRQHDRPSPLPVVVTGLALGLLPGSEGFGANPELVLTFALPPLLFGAALESSFIGIRANLRPILLLSVGLVVFTAVVVALAIRLVVPEVSWPVALTLGAVLGPTDAVAASAIGGRLGLPPRILTILEGESLVNDGTGLTLFRVAVAADGGRVDDRSDRHRDPAARRGGRRRSGARGRGRRFAGWSVVSATRCSRRPRCSSPRSRCSWAPRRSGPAASSRSSSAA